MAPRGTITNLLLQTGFSSGWSLASVSSFVADAMAPPAEVASEPVYVFADDGNTGGHYVFASPTLTAGRIYVASAYFRKKAGANDWAAITPNTGAIGVYGQLSTATVGGGGGGTLPKGVYDAGGGWCRLWQTFICVNNAVRFYMSNVDGGVASTPGTSGAAQMALCAPMVEEAYPGQTSPQLFTRSGATPGVGRRDTRQNLIPWSEDFTKAWRTKVRSDIADGLSWTEDNSATTTHELRVNGTGVVQPVAGVPATLIARVKKGARDYVALLGNAGGTSAFFNLTDGSLGAMTGAKAINRGIAPVRNQAGWYDVWHSFLFDGTYAAIAMSDNSPSTVFTGVNGQIATYIARAQLVGGSGLPDYVLTKGGIWCPNGAPRLAAV